MVMLVLLGPPRKNAGIHVLDKTLGNVVAKFLFYTVCDIKIN